MRGERLNIGRDLWQEWDVRSFREALSYSAGLPNERLQALGLGEFHSFSKPGCGSIRLSVLPRGRLIRCIRMR